jgi:lauroyl/myristoyl acyltransferase
MMRRAKFLPYWPISVDIPAMKYLQLKLAEFIARLLPRRIGYGIARRIADIYLLFDRPGRESVMANLQHIHQFGSVSLSPRALRALARENFLNFAKYLVDFFHFLHLKPERMRRIIDFGRLQPMLDELLGHGKGVIFVSAHLGNWELGAAAVAALGYKFNAVVLWQPDPKVNRLYQRQRMARNMNPIPMGRAARECIAALRRNEVVALLADRDFTGSRDTVEFFGRPARLPNGPAKLALATGAPLLPVFVVRLPDDTFRFVVEDPIWADKSNDTVAGITYQVALMLERVIKEYSEQWFLFHNLWDIEEDRVLATTASFGAPPADAVGADEEGSELPRSPHAAASHE